MEGSPCPRFGLRLDLLNLYPPLPVHLRSPFLAAAFGVIATTAVFSAPSDDLFGYWQLENNTTDSAPGGAVSDDGSWSDNTGD